MKIISLQAENIKKLVAVEIKPDGNMVEITGRNGQGKTSVLDSIWWALAGTKHIQSAPIRKGESEARIRLDLGDIIVSRRFWKNKTGADESSISVENADGARYPSPQKMIDALLGELSFDPLAFARMAPKDQFNALKRFVPDIDFKALAMAEKDDRDHRTEKGRLADQERAAAQVISVPAETPTEEVDEAALVEQLAKAGDVERRKANRRARVERITGLRETETGVATSIEKYTAERQKRCDRDLVDIDNQIKALRLRADNLRSECDEEIRIESGKIADEGREAKEEADQLQATLDAAGPLPDIDVAVLSKQIEAARATNVNVRKLVDRNKHLSTAKRLDGEYDALTSTINKRQADRQAAIAAADIPVPGIGFGDDEILLNGVPFEQASDGEQLRASVAIAMALNPKLRVIRIRDGSLLDEHAMKLLAEMADKHDMQVWIERVDSSGKIGFVLEDGHVRHAVPEQLEAVSA